ncbi:hypothetical protein POM88_041634 [Heracleum sosnowskyi]|uniref:Uncharacterized protein n=1 Tax=Heracleum sosnowskyi TaxID=360622 RepID=A0AAD8HH03_9APIA|nr:hypothetical protein POM88_041634 [Heracleum sosnowskyi]
MNLQQAMAGKPIRMTLFIGIVLLLLGDFNYAIITESPAPQPQPSEDLPSPMYGATPGSLQPQDCGPQCMGRCAKTAFKKPCNLFISLLKCKSGSFYHLIVVVDFDFDFDFDHPSTFHCSWQDLSEDLMLLALLDRSQLEPIF